MAYARHGGYNRALYNSYSDLLESHRQNYESTKDLISAVKTAVLVKMVMDDFTESEKTVIYTAFDSIKTGAAALDASINDYEASLKVFRGW